MSHDAHGADPAPEPNEALLAAELTPEQMEAADRAAARQWKAAAHAEMAMRAARGETAPRGSALYVAIGVGAVIAACVASWWIVHAPAAPAASPAPIAASAPAPAPLPAATEEPIEIEEPAPPETSAPVLAAPRPAVAPRVVKPAPSAKARPFGSFKP